MRALGAALILLAVVGCKSKKTEPDPEPELEVPAPVLQDPDQPEPTPFHCQGRAATIDINRADPDFSDRVTLDCKGGPITVELHVRMDRKKEPEIRTYEIEPALFEAAWQRIGKSGWKTLGETCDGLPEGDLYAKLAVSDGAIRRKLSCNRVSSPVLVELDRAARWIAGRAREDGETVVVADIPPPDDLPPGVDETYAPPQRVPVDGETIEDTKGWTLSAESLGTLTLGVEAKAVAELGPLPRIELWSQKGLICSIVLVQPEVPTEAGPGVGDELGEFRDAYGALEIRPDKTVVAGPYLLTLRKPGRLATELKGRRGKKAMKLAVGKIAIDQCEPPPASAAGKKR